MFFRKAKLIAQLRQHIAWLTGQLAQSEQKAEGYRGLAEKALEVAREKHFPQPIDVYQDGEHIGTIPPQTFDLNSVLSTYQPPEVKHCPECSVSVRSATWPQECPACHCVFGFNE